MGHSQIGVVDPVTGLQAKVLPDAEADTGQAGLAVRVISGPSSGAGAVTIADGANVVEGATTDAANTTGATGTISGKLRGIVTLLAGILQVGGNVASGGADSGNPVKVGGKYNLTQPTFTDGQRGDLQLDSRGHLEVSIGDGTGGASLSNVSAVGTDAINSSGSQTALNVRGFSALFNETSWDRQRSNTTAALIAAATATTQTNKQITNYNARSLAVILNVTTATAATLTVTINGSTASGYTYQLLAGTAVATTGTTVYRIAPGLTAVSNLTVSDLVPRNLLVTVTITGTVAYGVDYELSI